MNSIFHRAGHALGRHLDRLRSTFDDLRDRLRDAVVHAVGQTVAGAVRDTIRGVLEGVADSSREAPSAWSRSPPRWQDQHDGLFNEDRGYDDHRYEPEHRGWYDNDDIDDQPDPPPRGDQSQAVRPSRLRQALAIGCSAAGWHLRRQVSRVSGLATIGIGLASAVGAYVVGPGLIASAFSLIAFSETMHAVGALSLFGGS